MFCSLCLFVCCDVRLGLDLLEFLDMVAQLEGGSQFEAHVLHNHVAAQEQQGLPIDLVFSEEFGVGTQGLGVSVADKLHDVLYAPGGGVATGGPGAATNAARVMLHLLVLRTRGGAGCLRTFHLSVHACGGRVGGEAAQDGRRAGGRVHTAPCERRPVLRGAAQRVGPRGHAVGLGLQGVAGGLVVRGGAILTIS